MNKFDELQEIAENKGKIILKAFGQENNFEKGNRLNHKYLRKEGDKYIYEEGEKKNDKYTETGSLRKKRISEMTEGELFPGESKGLSSNFKKLLIKQGKEKEILDDKYDLLIKEHDDLAYKYPRSENENKRILELRDEIHKIKKEQENLYNKHNKVKEVLFTKENPKLAAEINKKFDNFSFFFKE